MLAVYKPEYIRRLTAVVVGSCLTGFLFCRLWFQAPDLWWFFLYERHHLIVVLDEYCCQILMQKSVPLLLKGASGSSVRFLIGNPRFVEPAGRIPSKLADVGQADEIWIYRAPVEDPFLVGFKGGRCIFARSERLDDHLWEFERVKAKEIETWIIGKSKSEIEAKFGRCSPPFGQISLKDWWRSIKCGEAFEEPSLWFYFDAGHALIFKMQNDRCVEAVSRSFFY